MRYQVTTRLTPQKALTLAESRFGPQGEGLKLVHKNESSLTFQGGGGHVSVLVQPGETTTLELETREWDYPVRQFIQQISAL